MSLKSPLIEFNKGAVYLKSQPKEGNLSSHEVLPIQRVRLGELTGQYGSSDGNGF